SFLSREPEGVFRASLFHPIGAALAIRHGRLPRRREDAWILDGEFKLQVLARPTTCVWLLHAEILFSLPLPTVLCGILIDEPVSLDDMQGRRERRPIPVHRGIGPYSDPYGVDNQCVAFVMAHGVAIPARCHPCRMRLV